MGKASPAPRVLAFAAAGVSSPMAEAVCSAASTSPGLEEVVFLFGMVRPDAGKTIGLQLDANLDLVGRVRGRPPSAARFEPFPGRRAGSARDGRPHAQSHRPGKTCRPCRCSRGSVARSGERTRCPDRCADRAGNRTVPSPPARCRSGLRRRTGEYPEPGGTVSLAARAEDFLPNIFRTAEHGGDEVARLVAWRAAAWEPARSAVRNGDHRH